MDHELVSYDDFRTGLTFADVKAMLWSGDPDPSTWRYRRRHTVLGHWRQIKQQLYAEYLDRFESEQERRRAPVCRAVRPARRAA